MVKIFNHYLHKQVLLQVVFDLFLVLCAIGIATPWNRIDAGLALSLLGYGLLLACGFLAINISLGLYQRYHHRSVRQSYARAFLSLLLTLPFAYVLFGGLPDVYSGRDRLLLAAIAGVIGVIAHRVYAAHAAPQPGMRYRVLIFGTGPRAAKVGKSLQEADRHVDVVGYYASPNETEQQVSSARLLPSHRTLAQTVEDLKIDEVVVALGERRGGSMPLRELLDCKLRGVRVVDMATHFETVLGQIRLDSLYAGWLIFGDGFGHGGLRVIVKRLFDIVCALVLIVLSLPVMLVTAALIKLESKGGIFYFQERTGFNGKPFNVVKFRSMRTDAEKDGKPQWAQAQDSRVTRVGNIIRKIRVDELPQLFVVLKGDMSLVGPRPERPFFVEQLTSQIPYYAVRQSVKPGLTGWAQVRYHYGATLEDSAEKLQYDLYYVKNHSLFLDLVILFETVSVVLLGKGAR
jgi:sugar transferase (PEP-CTERM system associated)